MSESNLSVKDTITQRYQNEGGRSYHATVHVDDRNVSQVIAIQRARKLQPFIRDDDHLLEFGAGLGVNLLQLKCASIMAYDASDAGTDQIQGAGIVFTTDFEQVAAKKFSVVLCHHVLEHVSDPTAILEQIHSLLQPGGRMILCVPFEASKQHRRFNPDDPHQHLFTWNAQAIGNLVSAVGFKVDHIEIRSFGYEQRLAFLAKVGELVYRCALKAVRTLLPVEEVLVVAKKTEE
jgi:SAM-dependent methyltransferase